MSAEIFKISLTVFRPATPIGELLVFSFRALQLLRCVVHILSDSSRQQSHFATLAFIAVALISTGPQQQNNLTRRARHVNFDKETFRNSASEM